VNERVRSWYAAPALETNLAESLAPVIARLTDEATATAFHAHCQLPGTDVRDFFHKVVRLPDGTATIAGLRFEGSTLDHPFIAVFASTNAMTVERCEQARVVTPAAFSTLAPRAVRVWSPLDGDAFPTAWTRGKRHVATPLRELAALAREPSPRVTLVRATVDAIYDRYAATYAELHATRPELVAAARQEPREDLEDYAAEGGLFSILVDERWAGLAAVFRANEYGLRGYCIGELVLTAETRGSGFARSIQQRLAHALDDRGDDVLFGHIHPINLAAQRSAHAAGRHDVGGMLWMPCG
jgi:hypothetical protein